MYESLVTCLIYTIVFGGLIGKCVIVTKNLCPPYFMDLFIVIITFWITWLVLSSNIILVRY